MEAFAWELKDDFSPVIRCITPTAVMQKMAFDEFNVERMKLSRKSSENNCLMFTLNRHSPQKAPPSHKNYKRYYSPAISQELFCLREKKQPKHNRFALTYMARATRARHHNERAKIVSRRIRSVKILQSFFRRLFRDKMILLSSIRGDFEKVLCQLEQPRVITTIGFIANLCDCDSLRKNPKQFLTAVMIANNAHEVLSSFSLEKQSELKNLSKQLLYECDKLLLRAHTVSRAGFLSLYAAFQASVTSYKEQDIVQLTEELFDAFVRARVQYEVCSSRQDEWAQGYLAQAAVLQGKVKKLLPLNEYKSFLLRAKKRVAADIAIWNEAERKWKDVEAKKATWLNSLLLGEELGEERVETRGGGIQNLEIDQKKTLWLLALKDIVNRIIELVPNRKDIKRSIEAKVDFQLLEQMLLHNALDFNTVREVFFFLCAQIDQLSTGSNELVKWLDALLCEGGAACDDVIEAVLDRFFVEISKIEKEVKEFYSQLLARALEKDETIALERLREVVGRCEMKQATRKWLRECMTVIRSRADASWDVEEVVRTGFALLMEQEERSGTWCDAAADCVFDWEGSWRVFNRIKMQVKVLCKTAEVELYLRQIFNECRICFAFNDPIQHQPLISIDPSRAEEVCLGILRSKKIPSELVDDVAGRAKKRMADTLVSNSKLYVILQRRLIHFLVHEVTRLDLKSIALQQFESEVFELKKKMTRLLNSHTNIYQDKYKDFLDSL